MPVPRETLVIARDQLACGLFKGLECIYEDKVFTSSDDSDPKLGTLTYLVLVSAPYTFEPGTSSDGPSILPQASSAIIVPSYISS